MRIKKKTAKCVKMCEESSHIDEQPTAAGVFARRPATAVAGPVGPAVQTAQVGLNEAPDPQYDLMTDLLHADMFKVISDMLRSETLRI